MSLNWTTAAAWLAHSAAGGAVLLLLTWALARRTRQPVRRQRLAEWGVAAALVVAALSWAPAWLVIDWASAHTPPAPKAQPPELPAAFVPATPPEVAVFDLHVELPAAVEQEAMLPALPALEPPVAPAPVETPAAPPFPDPVWLAALGRWLVAGYALLAAWFGGR